MDDHKNSVTISVGPGLVGLTFLLFLALKLCGVIDWSWWWVTSPLWIGGAFALAVLLFAAVLIGAAIIRRK